MARLRCELPRRIDALHREGTRLTAAKFTYKTGRVVFSRQGATDILKGSCAVDTVVDSRVRVG